MTNHKEDEEIKRCLRLCSSGSYDCNECSYSTPGKGDKTCTDLLLADALWLINKHEKQIVDLTDSYADKLTKIISRISK